MVTYIFLLFVNVADLEPNIGVGKRARRIPENAVKAPERVFVLALLLVYYSQSEENFVGLVKV